MTKGFNHSQETKDKMRLAKLGKKRPLWVCLKIANAKKGNKNALGHILSEESKRKMSEANKGKKHTEESKLKMSLARKGKKSYEMTEEIKEKMRIPHIGIRGNKHPRWIEDRTKLQKYNDNNLDRRSSTYREWRKNVWIRDGFRCRINNCDCSGKIIAHHILGWTKFPELRYEVNNGITLCQFHHPRKRNDEKKSIPIFQSLLLTEIIKQRVFK